MSKSIVAPSIAARKARGTSRKSVSRNLAGTAAIGGAVLGCGWMIYTNILGANVYPTIESAGYDEPVTRGAPKPVTRSAAQTIHETFAELPKQAPTTVRAQAAASITQEMFNDRFAAAAPTGVASNAANGAPPAINIAEVEDTSSSADVSKIAGTAKVADAAKAKRGEATRTEVALNEPPKAAARSGLRDMADRAKAAVMSIASNEKLSIVEKLWGKPQSSSTLLAYAAADADVTASIAPKVQNPMLGGSPPYDRSTAVYDITAKTVYLPDGTKLEAHSGLGSHQDNPRSANIRMRGVTPPHIYTLKPREALFHGVPALRLTPVGGESAIHGRDGLLAHTFMLGSSGASNGCVSFRNYYAFLDAYRSKGIRKLAVVARI